MACEKVSVADLSQKTDMLVAWDKIEDLVSFMNELIEAKREPGRSSREREQIYALGQRIEQRAIDVARREVSEAVADWNSGLITPRELIYSRDYFLEQVKQAHTSRLRRAFYASAIEFKKLLAEGSERQAELRVVGIENSLDRAEDLLTASREISFRDWQNADDGLKQATQCLLEIRGIKHVNYVGLPIVSKKRGLTPDALVESLEKRLRDLREALHKAHREIYEKERAADAQEALKERERSIEQNVRAITNRSEEAGYAARQFLENARLGNSGAAKSWLDKLKRLDGGVPPLFQEEFGKVLRQKNVPRLIRA